MDGHIDCFYCHHQFQRQGIGAALMKRIFAEAHHNHLTRLYAEVSTTARDFFIDQGFKVNDETNNVVCGHPAKQYLMSRSLDLEEGHSFQDKAKLKSIHPKQ